MAVDTAAPLRLDRAQLDAWETADESRRHNPVLMISSQTVHSLFGESVGNCFGDFHCTHNRIRGRLYATNKAILFYTSLLGIERRFCLYYRDVYEMDLYRTTSIRVNTVDCETYIFRSFNNREQVLHLLRSLQGATDQHGRQRAATAPLALLEEQLDQFDAPPPTPLMPPPLPLRQSISSSSAVISCIPPPLSFNRRRAVSDSYVRSPTSRDRASRVVMESKADASEGADASDTELLDASGRLSRDGETIALQWYRAKQGLTPALEDVGIESLALNCSLDMFHSLFLADEASYSLCRFQRDTIRDENVEVAMWQADKAGAWHRTLTFTHPIRNAMGIGPSAAETTRRQHLEQYPGYGMLLENTTLVEGLPCSDAFHVKDRWVVEAIGDDKIVLSTSYAPQFTKRTMFKGIIEKSIRKETKEWYTGYAEMVQTALKEAGKLESISTTTMPTSEDHGLHVKLTEDVLREFVSSIHRLLFAVILALGLGIALQLLQLVWMHQTISILREELRVFTRMNNERMAD